MTFVLGDKSLANMAGVHPYLKLAVCRAIAISTVDFGVVGGAVRTAAEQNALYQKGRTTPGPKVTDKDGYKHKSNHQITADGTGHSVDLTAWVDGKWDFDTWPLYHQIAWAMCQAATELGFRIRWGGNWNEDLLACKSLADVVAMEGHYRGTLHDGPHFELVAWCWP